MAGNRGLGVIHAVLIAAVFSCVDVSAAERTLVFPSETRVGTLTLCDPPRRKDGFIQTQADNRISRPAVGRITVPDDRYVVVEFGTAISDAAVRSRVSLEGIDSIWMSGEVTKDLLKWLGSSGTLFELRIGDATFAMDAFDDAPEMPNLAIFSFDAKDKKRPLGPGFARWCSKMPALEYLYARPELSSTELIELDGHPRLAFLNVEVSDQRASPFETLARLPALRGLNFHVVTGTAFASIVGLDQLKHLEVLNWNQGHADGRVITQLSKIKSLRKLQFYDCTIGGDLVENLPALDTLEGLSISATSDSFTPLLAKIPESLFKMPRLKSWPELRQVDWETLQKISKCDWIERLEIQSVRASVTAAKLAEWDISRLTRLNYLELASVPVDDAWLQKLSAAKELELLRLYMTNVSGKGLDALKDLEKLSWIDLDFEGGPEPSLEALSKCRFVKRFELHGELLPRQIEPLKNCRQLRELQIWDGVTDDSTAEWLSSMPDLEELDLGDGCYMTDRGAALIAKMPRLQRLDIGGAITPEGVAVLTKTPLLTWLVVHSTQLNEDDNGRLLPLGLALSYFDIGEFRGQKERIEQLLLKGR
jgi:hypothetical protein